LGAHVALERSGRDQRMINEDRMAREALADLQSSFPPDALSRQMTLGEGLGARDVCALLAEALAQDVEDEERT
ncbi:MAG TPA: hypothetical protein VFN64_01400, partial [Burkholderiaceae bacterium]|nr:hypothetical protein [Burkholderiaceae bacterium]